MSAMDHAETFRHVADMFRRRRFKSALGLINALLEQLHIQDSFLRTRLTVLQVYCNLKLQNFPAALIPLDSLTPLTTDPVSSHTLNCSSDEFILQLFAAIFPLCLSQVARRDVSQRPAPFPHPQHASSLQRLYLLLDWTRRSVLALPCDSAGDLIKIWTQRHSLVVRILVDALVQLELYEVALALIHSDILAKNPKSPLGVTMLGIVYLIMGDLQSAEYHFGIAECLTDVPDLKPRIATVEGFLHLANGNFPEAVTKLQDAENRVKRSAAATKSERAATATSNKVLATGELEMSVATNNLAVSLLYNGFVRAATDTLDAPLTSLSRKPFPFLVALRNLITLYEFAPQRGRKIALLRQSLSEIGTDEAEVLQLLYETGEEAKGG